MWTNDTLQKAEKAILDYTAADRQAKVRYILHDLAYEAWWEGAHGRGINAFDRTVEEEP